MRMLNSERATLGAFGRCGKRLRFFGDKYLVFDGRSSTDLRIYQRVVSNSCNFSVVNLPIHMNINASCKNCGCSLRPYMPRMIGKVLTKCPLCEKEVTELNE